MLRLVAVWEKRQILMGLALFLCLSFTACARPGPVTTACTADIITLEKRRVEAVVDGDTLRLAGGQRVRLIGLNTPEMGRDGRPAQPLANDARAALGALAGSGDPIWLRDGVENRDRYGRRLAYAFDAQGRSLSQQLLAQGLGFQVAISPNFAYVGCLQEAESDARAARLGVWAESGYRALSAAELGRSRRGFLRLRDEVTHVSFKDNGWWLQLGGKVGVRISRDDQHLFSRSELRQLQGRVVEARGWLVPMDDNWWMMNLGHPSMLEISP